MSRNKVTLGGDRLGTENKMQVDTRTYERSTFDPGQTWISSMSPGTLVPCYAELRLPGDTSEIDIVADIMTHPTIGPLFNSFKFEIDFFQVPVRLFNPRLTMDEVGLGMEIEDVTLPRIKVSADYVTEADTIGQINSSSILAYFDKRGIGHAQQEMPGQFQITREFQMIKELGYWEIYKNFYANKQEKVGAVIHNNLLPNNYDTTEPVEGEFRALPGGETISMEESESPVTVAEVVWYEQTEVLLGFSAPLSGDFRITPNTITIQWGNQMVNALELFTNYQINEAEFEVRFWGLNSAYQSPFIRSTGGFWINNEASQLLDTEPLIATFPLENIDKMRKQIMRSVDDLTPFTIDEAWGESADGLTPYKYLFNRVTDEVTNKSIYSIQSSQEGLGLATYMSDVNNNWLDKEWIDGDNGVNAITAIQVDAEGKFTLDQLNLQGKMYKMLNAIAMSDGSFRAWQLAAYDHEGVRIITTPMYLGSLIKEMVFQEVVSNAATADQPLGTIAGKGRFTNKHKGGKIKVGIDEVSYVIGIVSLRPRVTYSQGNKWDNLIENYQQLHTPALDQLGFGNLITDTLDYRDTGVHPVTGAVEYKSAGKQPAWINYTTNVNKAYGSFAEENNEMFMTLNRRYEVIFDGVEASIKDLTTYIDPGKYNYFFAYSKIDAQNFWVQIGFNEKLRRKMSAKLIPQM